MAEAWAFSSSQHIRAATDDVESYLKKKGLSFPKSCVSPLLASYRPNLDVTPELSTQDPSYFQSIAIVLRCLVEQERV